MRGKSVSRERIGGQGRGDQASRRLHLVPSPKILRCRRKFLRFFPGGFYDPTYLEWEHNYKWIAHQRWNEVLGADDYSVLLRAQKFSEIANRAIKIESRTNLLFSFEKMAIRDAVKSSDGARAFSKGLYDFLYGEGSTEAKFEKWRDVVAALPRKQTRVLTWPVLTVWGFIAQPLTHIFLKPNVTRLAAAEYGFDFHYQSVPSWPTYAGLLNFAETISRDMRHLKPRDLIDIQSFIWVLGSNEYDL